MVKSKNSNSELTIKASWFRGIVSYGKIMVGNKAFEFYNERNVNDYVQVPWTEINYVIADVRANNYILRFKIETKRNGAFVFSSRDNKKTLRAIRNHVPEDRLRRALTTWQKLKRKFSHN